MFLTDENGDLVSFSEYCLSESIKPKVTEYGTDESTSNRRIEHVSRVFYTFMQASDAYWCVLLKDDGEVGFGRSDEFSTDPRDYSDERTNTRSALQVYGKVLYVMLEIFDKKAPNTMTAIKFGSANPAAGKVYDRMVKNKWLLDELSERGLEYIGVQNGEHIFRTKYSKGFA